MASTTHVSSASELRAALASVQNKDPSKPDYHGDLFINPFAKIAAFRDHAPKAGSPINYGESAEARCEKPSGDTSTPPNAAPIAKDDNASTTAGKAVVIKILANDYDPNGDALAVTSVAKAANGAVTQNADGTVAYTPATGFTGKDSFTYAISDGKGGTDSAEVAVSIAAASPIPAPVPDSGNAILFELSPTGASAVTAGYDNLPSGVASSHQMAEMDVENVSRFVERFEIAGEKHDLPPALLAAIASRESRGGAGLDKNGEGDGGNAVGIMQIDKRWHDPVDTGRDFGSQGHINQAASIFLDNFEQAKEDYPQWGEAVQLQAATAAYNRGSPVFKNGPKGFDVGTAGGDYSNDVIARAQYYAENWDLLSDEVLIA